MNKGAIYITGHKNPDSDSICSVLAYAHLKQALGENAVGVRIGEVNNETRFILDYFEEDAPPLVYDIRTRVRDIEFDDVVVIRANGMLHEAIELMRAKSKKVIAVVGKENKLLGMATISDITNTIVYETVQKNEFIRQTPMENFGKILNGHAGYIPNEHRMNGSIFIASTTAIDKDSKEFENRIVITSARKDTQLKAISSGAALVIATGAETINNEVLELAVKHGCGYIVTSKDMYQTAQLVKQAIPVSLIMTANLVSFQYDDYVEDVKITINRSRFRSYPVLDQKGSIVGFISRYHLFKHANRRLILVDHNEMDQSIIGADKADILEIIDHHRIGGIKTASPVLFRNELVGCCATIISRIYQEKEVAIPKSIAGLLCGAIISDTMNFNSPTSTKKDEAEAKYLAEIAGIDLSDFAPKVMKASASISEKTIEEIVYNDLKIFEIEKYKVAIGQMNIMDLDDIYNIREEVKDFMTKLGQSNSFGVCVMIFSMVDGSGSYILYTGPDSFILESAFNELGETRNGYLFLKEVLSRKKQIVPLLSEAARAFNSQFAM